MECLDVFSCTFIYTEADYWKAMQAHEQTKKSMEPFVTEEVIQPPKPAVDIGALKAQAQAQAQQAALKAQQAKAQQQAQAQAAAQAEAAKAQVETKAKKDDSDDNVETVAAKAAAAAMGYGLEPQLLQSMFSWVLFFNAGLLRWLCSLLLSVEICYFSQEL